MKNINAPPDKNGLLRNLKGFASGRPKRCSPRTVGGGAQQSRKRRYVEEMLLSLLTMGTASEAELKDIGLAERMMTPLSEPDLKRAWSALG